MSGLTAISNTTLNNNQAEMMNLDREDKEGSSVILEEISKIVQRLTGTLSEEEKNNTFNNLQNDYNVLCKNYQELYECAKQIKLDKDKISNNMLKKIEKLAVLVDKQKNVAMPFLEEPAEQVEQEIQEDEGPAHLDDFIDKLTNGLSNLLISLQGNEGCFSLPKVLYQEFYDLNEKSDLATKQMAKFAKEFDTMSNTTKQNMAIIQIKNTQCQWEVNKNEINNESLSELEVISDGISAINRKINDLKLLIRDYTYTNLDDLKCRLIFILKYKKDEAISGHVQILRELLQHFSDASEYSHLKDTVETLESHLTDQPKLNLSKIIIHIQKLVDEIKIKKIKEIILNFEEIKNIYNELMSSVASMRQDVEGKIEILKEDNEDSLASFINGISFYDKKAENSIKSQTDEAIENIEKEKNDLEKILTRKWTEILNAFSEESSSLWYAINRCGYAIFQNKGTIPRDVGYTWAWKIDPEYVNSIETEEEEETEIITEQKSA